MKLKCIYFLNVFMFIIVLVFFSSGIFLINRSQLKYDTVPCAVLNMVSVKCSYTFFSIFKNMNYYSDIYLNMSIYTNNSHIETINMEIYCWSCSYCANIYTIGSKYDCLLNNNGSYIITQYIDGVHTNYLFGTGILLLICSALIICTFMGSYIAKMYFSRRSDYDELI
jgi:hypothetical protein